MRFGCGAGRFGPRAGGDLMIASLSGPDELDPECAGPAGEPGGSVWVPGSDYL